MDATIEPTLVCTDGSSLGRPSHERGYAAVFATGHAHFGPVGEQFGRCDTELYAIYVALTTTAGPVRIVTDCVTAEHLAAGTLPRAEHEHAVISAIHDLSAGRSISYDIRLKDSGPPQHAVAHYLAFRGRRGEVGAGVLIPEALDVLHAAEPYRYAADEIRFTLFPTTRP